MNARDYLPIILAFTFLSPALAEVKTSGSLAVGTKIASLHLENGRTYENVTITKIHDEGVSIRHDSGLTRIKFDQIAGNLQETAKDFRHDL